MGYSGGFYPVMSHDLTVDLEEDVGQWLHDGDQNQTSACGERWIQSRAGFWALSRATAAWDCIPEVPNVCGHDRIVAHQFIIS